MPQDIAATREQLRNAFPRVRISGEGAFSSWGHTYLDGQPYATQLDGKAWDELDRAYLAVRDDALGFLGTDHLAAVLPVYLDIMLELDPFSSVPGMLMLILTKPGLGTQSGLGKQRFGALVERLTGPQRSAVAAALARFKESQDPDTRMGDAASRALASWTDYLTEDKGE